MKSNEMDEYAELEIEREQMEHSKSAAQAERQQRRRKRKSMAKRDRLKNVVEFIEESDFPDFMECLEDAISQTMPEDLIEAFKRAAEQSPKMRRILERAAKKWRPLN